MRVLELSEEYLFYGVVDDLFITAEGVSASDVDVVGALDGHGRLNLPHDKTHGTSREASHHRQRTDGAKSE